MTLLQLQELCERIGRQVTSADIPLKMHNCDIDLELELLGENGNYWVDVKLKRKPVPIEEFKEAISKQKVKSAVVLNNQTRPSMGDIEI